MAQGDEQVATLIHIGGIEAEHGAEGVGTATARVGAGVDGQGAAATRDGIGANVVGKGRAEFARRAGGAAEFDTVLAPVARAGRPGGLADPETEGQPLNFGAGRQVAQQFFGIDELQGPRIGSQRHVQAAVPSQVGWHGEGGGVAQAGDCEAVGTGEAAGGGHLQIDQVEAIGERNGRAGVAGADGQQRVAVQAEVDQRSRIFGGGRQAQAGGAGRHRERVDLRFWIEVRIKAAGVGAEVGEAGVGGQALDRAEAEGCRADGTLVGRAVVAEAERPGAVGFGGCQAAKGGVKAGDGSWIGLAGATGCRGSVQAWRHGRCAGCGGPQMAAAGAVGKEVGAVEVRAAAEILRRGGANAAEQNQAAAAVRRGQHGFEIPRPCVGEGQADGDPADVLGEAADRDRHDPGLAWGGWGAGNAVGDEAGVGTGERVGEGIEGGVQMPRQGAFETAVSVAKHQGCLMLPAGQVGGGGFEGDGDHG